VKASRQRAVADRLRAVAGDAAMIEARWLLEEAGADDARLEAFVARRLFGEPVDRIIGRRGFWTLDLKVTPATLSPRSDTETVVRAGRDAMLARHDKHAPLRILDLGTGTGAILLALLDEFPKAAGMGIDISEDALLIARENAGHTGLSSRAAFQQSDWTAGLVPTALFIPPPGGEGSEAQLSREGGKSKQTQWMSTLPPLPSRLCRSSLPAGGRDGEGLTGPFDLIVSNPPYIPTRDIAGLDPEVREHDPHLALDGGADGLACYRALLPQIPALLAPGGAAVLEFGQAQGPAVLGIARACGLALVEFRNDLNGIERAVILNKI
jgi:release factor glutamine methyltransferase